MREDNYGLTDVTDELLEKMRTMMKHFTDFTSECLEDDDDEGAVMIKNLMKDYEEVYHLTEDYMLKNSLIQDTILIQVNQILKETSEIKKKLN